MTKRTRILAILIAAVSGIGGAARATEVGYSRHYGVGAVVGDPTGLSGKVWIGPRTRSTRASASTATASAVVASAIATDARSAIGATAAAAPAFTSTTCGTPRWLGRARPRSGPPPNGRSRRSAAAWGADDEAFAGDEAGGLRRAFERPEALVLEPAPGGATAWLQVGKPPSARSSSSTPDAGAGGNGALGAFAFRAAEALRAGERAGEHDARARADAGAPRRRRPGDRPALARAHARDRGRAGWRSACAPAGGRLPAGGRPPRDRRRAPSRRPARRGRPSSCSSSRSAFRARGMVVVGERRAGAYAPARPRASSEAGIEAAHAVPLVAHDDVIGLLRRLPPPRRPLTDERLGAPRRARRPARGRGRERAAARGGREQRGGRARARRRASARGAPTERAVRDLALVRGAALARRHARRARAHRGRPARGRRRRHPNAEQRGESLVVSGGCTSPTAASGPRSSAIFAAGRSLARVSRTVLGTGRAVPPRPAAAAEALGGSHALLVPFLEKWLDRRHPADLDADEVLATLTLALARPGAGRSRTRRRGRRSDRAPGRARRRQRAPLPAAEAVRRHDAALAAAARTARGGGARGRRGVRVVGAARRRRRPLRLPRARTTRGSRSSSATSPATASTPPPTWR